MWLLYFIVFSVIVLGQVLLGFGQLNSLWWLSEGQVVHQMFLLPWFTYQFCYHDINLYLLFSCGCARKNNFYFIKVCYDDVKLSMMVEKASVKFYQHYQTLFFIWMVWWKRLGTSFIHPSIHSSIRRSNIFLLSIQFFICSFVYFFIYLCNRFDRNLIIYESISYPGSKGLKVASW